MAEKKYYLKCNTDNPQFLGFIDGNRFVVSKEKEIGITESNLKILEKRKWFQYLIKFGQLEIIDKSKKKSEAIEAIEIEVDD